MEWAARRSVPLHAGAGEKEEAGRIMQCSYTLLLISGVVLTALGYLFLKPLLYLFGASDATYPYARDYMLIYLAGTLFVMVSLGMNNFINSQGFGRVGMLSVLSGAVANLVLDPNLYLCLWDGRPRRGDCDGALAGVVRGMGALLFERGKRRSCA